LLHFLGCGLKEDVAANGMLITHRESDVSDGTGLRFRQLNKHIFCCPACGKNVKESISKIEAIRAELVRGEESGEPQPFNAIRFKQDMITKHAKAR
jgi:hypothetical protein